MFTMIATDLPVTRKDKIHVCKYTELYITVIVNNSTTNNITSNICDGTIHPWVRILKATDNTWNRIYSYAFSNFSNIMYIDLSGNHINNIGMAFKGLEVLDSLNLSRNQIEAIDSETFTISKNKTKLHLLDLSHNLLSHLSNNVFENLWNLRMLYLQGNRISMIQDECYKYLKNLIYLNLCCNNLTNYNSEMKYLPYLVELNLSFNNLEQLHENALSGLVSLQELDLSHNKIETLPYNFLQQSTQLSKIDLSYNKIKNVSAFKDLHS